MQSMGMRQAVTLWRISRSIHSPCQSPSRGRAHTRAPSGNRGPAVGPGSSGVEVAGLRARSQGAHRGPVAPRTAQGDRDLVTNEMVLAQAREQFLSATRFALKDEDINIGKACLTISLEEEASVLVFVEDMLSKHTDIIATEIGMDLGGASTWNLGRLDLLAAEVMTVFHEQLAVAEVEGMEGMAARLDALDPADRVDLSQVLQLKPKPTRPGVPNIQQKPSSAWSQGQPEDIRIELFPLLMVNSINDVLYTRHGFRRSQQHGEPRESQINSVLEHGEGSPAAMGILYMEICDRVGLPVAGMPIDDENGQYFLLWPTKFPFKVGGTEFVIDPYSNGDLLRRDEVCELFGLEDSAKGKAIRPATKRQILAGLLSYMKTCYWALAIGCPPEPAFLEPMDSETVSELEWGMHWEEGSYHLSRALACAERQVHLLPACQKSQLQYGLLQYASGDYEAAWQELGVYLERGGGAEGDGDESVRVLTERIRMSLEFGVTSRPDEDPINFDDFVDDEEAEEEGTDPGDDGEGEGHGKDLR